MESYGHNRTRPRTEIFLDTSGLGSANPASEKRLVLVGSAQGGEPNKAYDVTSYSQAKQIFRGGELLDAIEFAWNPSPNLGGAGQITAIRVEDATAASLVQGNLTVTSKLYGLDANSIQVALSDNTTTNSKRFSVYFTKERYERVYDNIGNIFNITYTGTEASALLDIATDTETGNATTLTLSAGTAGTETVVREYDLGEGVYEDVNLLINDINNLPDFEATMSSLGDKNIKTVGLDEVTAQDITTEYTVTAVGEDLIKQTYNDPYVDVEVDRAGTFPTTIALTSLSGGSNGTVPTSWADKFEQVSNLGAYYLVALTSDEAIHGEVSQFIRDESEAGNPMRAFVGGALSESAEQLKARRSSLRNARVGLVGDSGTRRMSDGRVYNFPGYMYAALVAGIASGLEIGEPITYKHVSIESLDMKFSSDQLDQLDDAGVIMTEFVRNRTSTHFRIVSEVTTYNSASEPVKNRIGLGEISDFLTTDLRDILDTEFIGSRIQNTSASILKNRVESFLDNQKDVNGLIVDYNPDDVQVVISGNTARISFTVMPAQGLDYINVYINYEDQELVG